MKNLTPDLKDEIGVYIIQNEDTLETYFGSGVLNKRFVRHAGDLRRGNHENHQLQAAYDRNSNFVFIGLPVEATSKEEARALAFQIEQADISENIGNPLMLNISKDVGSNWRDMNHSLETKAVISQRLNDRWQDPVFREKTIAAQNEGRAAIPEEDKLAYCQKLRNAQLARYERDGGSPTKGQTRSEGFCRQNSQNITEKWQDPEYREKQRLARIGKENVAARKQVTVDGVVYPSLIAAAKAFGITKQGARGRILSDKNQS